jgi:hypothetical protein
MGISYEELTQNIIGNFNLINTLNEILGITSLEKNY